MALRNINGAWIEPESVDAVTPHRNGSLIHIYGGTIWVEKLIPEEVIEILNLPTEDTE